MAVRLDCNRGFASWKSSGPNQLQFGPLALTRALCPQPAMGDRVAGDWLSIRSYVLQDGHLFVSLMADGGIYEFEPFSAAGPSDPPS
ncbi:MAG: META domain-containing protein [Aphanocapsa lilacina HA4352-LM1]|nr:META domain-containing protein [Aphanocapsa lilacina HA4352-LM1]